MAFMTSPFFLLLATLSTTNAYFLMGMKNFIVTERLDPIVSPGQVSGHSHSVVGGSNFASITSTAALRQSSCTSTPIPQDKSNYWFPNMYFHWANDTFSSVSGGAVIYYLFPDQPGSVTPFPDDFRMISGDPTLRTYDASSHAQQAVTFLCLDFNGVSKTFNQLPVGVSCPSGIRSQINFPSCWDGHNTDSTDHKSHVAFPSDGPDKGTCSDPKFPVTLPRVFMEVYWGSQDWEVYRSQAKDTTQPFVFSNGDPTGYGYHADFIMGWEQGVLQRVVDECHCNEFGDPTCCAAAGIFDFEQNGAQCTIAATVNEPVLGSLPKLPGNNPITGPSGVITPVPSSAVPNPLPSSSAAQPSSAAPKPGPSSSAAKPAEPSSAAPKPGPSSSAAQPAEPSSAAPKPGPSSSAAQPAEPSSAAPKPGPSSSAAQPVEPSTAAPKPGPSSSAAQPAEPSSAAPQSAPSSPATQPVVSSSAEHETSTVVVSPVLTSSAHSSDPTSVVAPPPPIPTSADPQPPHPVSSSAAQPVHTTTAAHSSSTPVHGKPGKVNHRPGNSHQNSSDHHEGSKNSEHDGKNSGKSCKPRPSKDYKREVSPGLALDLVHRSHYAKAHRSLRNRQEFH